jgi:hypothetical protein
MGSRQEMNMTMDKLEEGYMVIQLVAIETKQEFNILFKLSQWNTVLNFKEHVEKNLKIKPTWNDETRVLSATIPTDQIGPQISLLTYLSEE